MQARVVAQASTLVTLIAFGVLAGTHQAQSDNSQPQEKEDHSWKRILGTSAPLWNARLEHGLIPCDLVEAEELRRTGQEIKL